MKYWLTGIGLLLCWCSVVVGSVRAEDVKKVHWALYNFPPYFASDMVVANSSLPGTGAVVDFIQYVKARMTDYQYEYEVTTIDRVIGLMQQGTVVCNPLLLKTPERESFIEFSRPIFVTLPHHIVIAAKNKDKIQPYLDKMGKVNFEQLIMGSDLRTSINRKRAYPPYLMTILDKATRLHDYQYRQLNSQDFSIPIQQLLTDRVDYIIAYPFEINWYLKKHRQMKTTSFAYFPITGMPNYALGRVGCTKNEQGKKIIQRLNQIIQQAGVHPVWHKNQQMYLDPKVHQRLEQMIQHDQLLE